MTRDRERYRAAARRQALERRRAVLPPYPQRITAALDLAGLYGPEVDRALGGEEPMVDEWEAGTRIPEPHQVDALAELTGQPVDFFYVEPVELSGPVFLCRRTGRGKGCEVIDPRPDAEVIEIPRGPVQGRLF